VVALLLTMAAGVMSLLLFGAQDRHPVARALSADLRPHCTALEVEQTIRGASPIDQATCLAIAGKTERARQVLLAMSDSERSAAIERIFTVAHPIADAGDDESAGPMMELVVELGPDNYMAVFHAGMAAFALGHDALAKQRLEQFLAMYAPRDIWRGRAEQALRDISAHAPLAGRQAHFPE